MNQPIAPLKPPAIGMMIDFDDDDDDDDDDDGDDDDDDDELFERVFCPTSLDKDTLRCS
jgi:hypothetical protein